MKIVSHYSDTDSQKFDGDVVKGVTGRVLIGKKDGAPHFCMRVFTITPGGFTPRHAHEWEHEILIHSGSGQVLQDGAWKDVSSGSVIFIPGNEEHQFRNNSNSELTFACLVPKGAPEL
jgi:quercetin dioxygenase-like cupin family protein